jgi:tetratricopeptide (TPR) repeat protein
MISPSNLEERRHSQEQALATAQHAVSLAPDFGDAHAILAEVLFFSLDFYGAAREYDRALAVAPGGVFVLATYARFALVLGHFDAALAAAQKAVGLDPLDSSSYVELAHALYFARRFAEVEAPLRKAQALSPRSTEVENRRIQALLRLGEFDQARQRCESVATPLDEDTRHRCLASAYRPLGRQADAERELKAYQALDKDTEAVSYARVYAQWGNKPMALLWLAKAEQLLDPRLIYIKVDPELDPVRDEPEFRGILARLNFPP